MRSSFKHKIHDFKAIVIGTSAGGINAVSEILLGLPGNFSLAVIIVQHVHANSDKYFIKYFNSNCKLNVKEAEEKEKIVGGYVYMAPPNYHLLIEKDKTFSLSVDEKVNYSRPSIDVLFESAAEVYKECLIGIILSGANNDGTRGLMHIKNYGGLTIVQDPSTAESEFMPKSAIANCKTDYILSPAQITNVLYDFTKN